MPKPPYKGNRKFPYDAKQRRSESLDLPKPDIDFEPVQCNHCRRMLGPDQFPNQPEDDRCKWCIASDDAKAAQEEHRQAMKLMEQVVQQAGGTASKAPKLDELCGKAAAYFGGIDGFIERWGRCFEEVLESKKGSIGALNHFSSIMKLFAENDRLHQRKEADKMSAAEIEREQKLEMLKILTELMADESKRELFSQLCRQHGISVGTLELENANS